MIFQTTSTHKDASLSLKITTVVKPTSMQNLIWLFISSGYLSGIKTTL